jgi:threonylcarbamoyladenosine tRNA methylthiotransferase MtaB
MPQVDGIAIKERAARLRAAGAEAVAHHLQAQLGKRHRILMEGPRVGRTEGFAEVRFADDQPVGEIVTGLIAGIEGTALTV